MLKSMTGYGLGKASFASGLITVETKSLNYRYLEIIVLLPEEISHFEKKVKELIQQKIYRGRISVIVNIEKKDESNYKLKINRKLINSYYKTLKDIKINSLFDSELEARFIEALRRVQSEELPVTLKKEVVNGKPGYFYKIGNNAWYIELQVNLNQSDGVDIPSRADFVFRPARARDRCKPIAVFTDGFIYHKERIGMDMAQRCAIAQSDGYHVWSLSWKDIENCFKNQGGYFENRSEEHTSELQSH